MAAVRVERRVTGDVPQFSAATLIADDCVIARREMTAVRVAFGSKLLGASTSLGIAAVALGEYHVRTPVGGCSSPQLGYGKRIDSWHRWRCVDGMTTIRQMTLLGFAEETIVPTNVVPRRKVWRRNGTSVTPIVAARERKPVAQKDDCRWHECAVPDFAHAGEIETLLTFAQAARMLGMTRRGFRRMADRGMVAVVHVSDWSPRVRPRELRRFAGEAISGHSDGFATNKPSDDRKSGWPRA